MNVKRSNQTLTAANPLPNTSATPSPKINAPGSAHLAESGADRLGLSLVSR